MPRNYIKLTLLFSTINLKFEDRKRFINRIMVVYWTALYSISDTIKAKDQFAPSLKI